MRFTCVMVLLAVVAFAAATDHPTDSCICPRIYLPICGSDGVTYSNKCAFECVKTTLVGRAAEDFQIARGGACDGPEIPEFLLEQE